MRSFSIDTDFAGTAVKSQRYHLIVDGVIFEIQQDKPKGISGTLVSSSVCDFSRVVEFA
jgi:hypothetical protein